MASLWKRGLVYLGLDDEEDLYDDYAEGPAAPVQRQPEQTSGVRPLVRQEPAAPAQQPPAVVRTMPSMAARVHVVEPAGFNEAQEVGDRLKANQPVILNIQGLHRDLQRRLIDFCSGLTYAIGGSMSRVADQVFLLTPSNVEVSQEEKDRLQARGLFSR